MHEKKIKSPLGILRNLARYPGLLPFLLLLLMGGSVHGQTITGNVFRDFNANGTKDNSATFNEIGVGGVTVTCTDSSGGTATTTTSTTTATLGTYTLSGCTGASRVVFSGLPIGDFSGPGGTDSKTNVQFVTAPASNVDYGVNYPKDYLASASPKVAIPIFKGGSNISGSFASLPVFVSYPWTNTGQATLPSSDALNSQVGSVWGVAYQRITKFAFASAFLKRHAELGPGGLGGIYKIDYSSGTAATSLFLDLENAPYNINLGTFDASDTARGFSTSNTLSQDDDAFYLTGKVGLGGLVVSDDQKDLYTINLYGKQLIKMRIGLTGAVPTGAMVTQYAIPTPTCNHGTSRPFAVEFYRSLVYVGLVCSAEDASGTSADLAAYVYTFNPATNTFTNTPLPGFPITLSYPKGKASISPPYGNQWYPWSDDFNDFLFVSGEQIVNPQPVLSDLDFTPSGLLVLSFMDRGGHQLGYANRRPSGFSGGLVSYISGGDALAMWNNGGTWTLESAGVVGTIATGCGPSNGQGPGSGEFFCNDNWGADHEEIGMGAGVVNSGRGTIKAAIMDPITYSTGGTVDWSLTDGAKSLPYELFLAAGAAGFEPTFGKAGGVGDIEILENPAPLQIGNRVWLDTDKDGIQDAGENGLDGLTVTLTCGSQTATTTTATVGGQVGVYYFTDGAGGISSWPNGMIPRNTSCTLSVGETTTVSGTTYYATKADIGANDETDADGVHMDSAGNASPLVRITFTTGFAGQNNHSFDFGYADTNVGMNIRNCTEVSAEVETDADSTPDNGYTFTEDDDACVTVLKPPACAINTPTVTPTCNNNGTAGDPSDDTFTFTISATGTGVGANYKVDKISPAPTSTVFASLNYGATSAASSSFPISGGNLTLTLTDNTTATCTLTPVTVTAPPTCSGVVPTADLELTKTSSSPVVRPGDTLTFTLTLVNKGPGTANGVVVRDMLP
ncbi:MAG: DUF11 domain-containing protein, partial [Bacteroidetes Order II. Incertae sedis bacterium]|nr:DUF11 domain-containing protein [Bacteroidetes Order II. bacterium]